MSEQLQDVYELKFTLIRASIMELRGKVVCEDVLMIDFDKAAGTYYVANLEGPDAWHGEDENKLEAIVKYLRARLGLPAENRPRFICPTCGYEEPEQ